VKSGKHIVCANGILKQGCFKPKKAKTPFFNTLKIEKETQNGQEDKAGYIEAGKG
jgi:hypothetical protein